MKKVLIIVSHLGAGCEDLCGALYKNPLIDWHRSSLFLNHPEVVYMLSLQPHKSNSGSGIWMKEVLFNHYFSHKVLYKMCTFIYLIREPVGALSPLVRGKSNMDVLTRYYIFRLRRIYEMARSTPGALFLDYDNLDGDKIKEYLGLEESVDVKIGGRQEISGNFMDSVKKVYDKYSLVLRGILKN